MDTRPKGSGFKYLEASAGDDVHVQEIYGSIFLRALPLLAISGTPGADFGLYAMEPGRDSGAFQKHLDLVLPSPEHVMTVTVPVTTRKKREQSDLVLHMSAAHEAIASEVRNDPTLIEDHGEELPLCYHEHPLVRRARDEGRRPPHCLRVVPRRRSLLSAVGRED